MTKNFLLMPQMLGNRRNVGKPFFHHFLSLSLFSADTFELGIQGINFTSEQTDWTHGIAVRGSQSQTETGLERKILLLLFVSTILISSQLEEQVQKEEAFESTPFPLSLNPRDVCNIDCLILIPTGRLVSSH